MHALVLLVLAAPVDPASDDFERTILGGNWAAYRQSQAEVVGGHDLCLLSAGASMNVGWTPLLFPADSFSEGTVVSAVAPGIVAAGVFVRRRASDDARYTFFYEPGSAQWVLAYDGPTFRRLGAVSAAAPHGNAVIRLDARGASPVELFGSLDGIVIAYATDSAVDLISTAGPMGLMASLSSTVSNATPPIYASWRGGTSRVAPPWDAGTAPPVDAGPPIFDAGQPTFDAGQPVVDAGTATPDAGSSPPPTTEPTSEEPGCGCTSGTDLGALALLAFTLLRAARRPSRSHRACGRTDRTPSAPLPTAAGD